MIGVRIDGSNGHIAEQHVFGHAFDRWIGELAKRVRHCHGTLLKQGKQTRQTDVACVSSMTPIFKSASLTTGILVTTGHYFTGQTRRSLTERSDQSNELAR